MPLLDLCTNVPLSDAQQAALSATLSAAGAQLLGKPESYVMVVIRQEHMRFAGSDTPTALLTLKSLGLPPRTTEYSAVLCDLLAEELGLDPARIYIEFADPPRSHWGWNRGTFA
jgi:phenylpyruvate tautomerase